MPDYSAIKWSDWVYYDETSLTFLRWNVKRGRGKVKDDVAGDIDKNGYTRLNLFGNRYKGHRIIWVLFHGFIDSNMEIDHIDGVRCNNKIDNLRLVTPSINRRNMSSCYKKKGGVTGVNFTTKGEYHYYTAQWCEMDGHTTQKHFSISKLGVEEAFRLACEYRQQRIDELNEQGAGYTDRHGT